MPAKPQGQPTLSLQAQLCGNGNFYEMKFRSIVPWVLACLLLVISPCWSQETNLESLPETSEKVADLWGNELRLYYDLPDNFLVFTDQGRGVQSRVVFGLDERNDMMLAYLRASNIANATKEDQVDPGISITLRDRKVVFKVARRDSRSWVVLYVDSENGESARFAVPQQWDLKDPKIRELIAIRQGFERLMLKAAL